jgi:hypothetical protein
MRLTAVVLLLCAFPFGSKADKPKVSRSMIKDLADSIDGRLRRIWMDDPLEVIGLTQGTYVSGTGAVFVSEVNLAPSAGISPFHPAITPDELKRIHEKKISRLPKLKSAMQDVLLNSPGSLDSMPGDEQIAVGITLFYWRGENTEGLPSQVVLHAQKRALLDIKAGRADKAMLATVVTVQEF